MTLQIQATLGGIGRSWTRLASWDEERDIGRTRNIKIEVGMLSRMLV